MGRVCAHQSSLKTSHGRARPAVVGALRALLEELLLVPRGRPSGRRSAAVPVATVSEGIRLSLGLPLRRGSARTAASRSLCPSCAGGSAVLRDVRASAGDRKRARERRTRGRRQESGGGGRPCALDLLTQPRTRGGYRGNDLRFASVASVGRRPRPPRARRRPTALQRQRRGGVMNGPRHRAKNEARGRRRPARVEPGVARRWHRRRAVMRTIVPRRWRRARRKTGHDVVLVSSPRTCGRCRPRAFPPGAPTGRSEKWPEAFPSLDGDADHALAPTRSSARRFAHRPARPHVVDPPGDRGRHASERAASRRVSGEGDARRATA